MSEGEGNHVHYHEFGLGWFGFWIMNGIIVAALSFGRGTANVTEVSDPVAQRIASCSMLQANMQSDCIHKIKLVNPD